VLQIILSLDDEEKGLAIEAINSLFKVQMPKIPDPEWIDPGDGSEAPLIDKYTEEEFLKYHLADYLERQTERYSKKQNIDLVPTTSITVQFS
jgi:hypothetical protein